MQIAKKVLAVFLAALMALGTFAVGCLCAASSAAPLVCFDVPETVYLKTGEYGTQWYLNSCGDNGQTPPAAKDTTGKLYFHCDGATDVRITVDSSKVTDLAATGTDTIADNDFRITGNGGDVITFTAAYTVDGIKREAKAYTVIYDPNRVPTGCASDAQSAGHDDTHDYLGFLTALWGAQRSDLKENVDKTDGADIAQEKIYLGNNGLVTAANRRPRNTDMVKEGEGTFGAQNHNDTDLSVSSPTAYFCVDTSRFSNMNQIPNMYVGLTQTDDQHTEYCEFTTYLAAGHTNGQTAPASIAPIISKTKTKTETVIRQEGTCTIDYDISALEPGSATDFTVFTYGNSYCKTDGVEYKTNSCQHTHFQIINTNKSALRNLYLSEMRKNFVRQENFYTSGWDSYETAMYNAAQVLGSPDVSYSQVTDAVAALRQAAAGLTAPAGEYQTGDVITFGSYPQSQVTDADLIAALNAQGGAWQSYRYCTGSGQTSDSYSDGSMTASDFMRYKDVSYDGEKYRAVTFDGYRPYWTGGSIGTGHSYQDDNGYEPGVVYWFRFDPLQWRVLDGMTGLVMCDTVIDAQPYQQYCLVDGKVGNGLPAYWGDAGKTFYANNYAESTIRRWLNGTFIQTAFSAEEEERVLTTALFTDSVNAWDGVPAREEFNAPLTEDRVFLLSFYDVTNPAYGFDSFKAYDSARLLQGSRYAQCQGLSVHCTEASAESGNAYWLLRSPGVDSNDVCHVDIYGTVRWYCDAEFTFYGICPAMTLDLRETPSVGSSLNTKLNVPGGATVGYKTSVHVTVTASDVPSGSKVALYDGETCLAEGEESVSWHAERIKESKILTARIVDSQGNVQSTADGKLEKQIAITVKTGFFAKVKAFFLGLFGLLPTVELKP